MNIHFIGTFTKSGEASFPLPATEYPLTRIANLLIDSTCLHETGEGTDLVLWGRILNLPEIYDRFGMKPGGNATLLDLFLAYPVEELLPLIDGNVTGILTTASSTLIFRDKNGGGLPVYYSGSYFSDHVEGIRMIAGALPEPNLKSLSMFLEYGYIPSPDTAFTGISKIPAGHLLVCKNGQFSIRNAFPFTDFTSQDNHLGLTLQEAADHYIHLHREAIRKRILGSDTVGALVSGGYDSGGNLAQLREVYQGPVKTFSIGFKGNPWSELPHSRQITQQYGTDHYEYIIDGHEIEYLPEIVRAFADPFQESGLMVNLCATKLLVGDHKVPSLLCGEGNDQLFGTAPKDLAWHYMANKTGLAILQKKIFTLFNQKPFLPGNLLFKLQFHNDKILHILCSDRFGFKAAEKRQLLKDYPGPSPFICADRTGKTSRDFTDLYLRKTYFTDLQQQTNEVIVYKAANSARLYGIDPAFPLLDLDIYRFITRLPVSFKMHGAPMQLVRGKGINKYLYKVSLSGKLPGQAVQRKKQGGFAPMVIFFEDESRRKRILEYITRSDMAKTLLNQDVLVTYFDQFCHDIRDQKIWFWYYQFRCFQLFSLLILAIWWDQFINNRVFTKLSDYIGVEVK